MDGHLGVRVLHDALVEHGGTHLEVLRQLRIYSHGGAHSGVQGWAAEIFLILKIGHANLTLSFTVIDCTALWCYFLDGTDACCYVVVIFDTAISHDFSVYRQTRHHLIIPFTYFACACEWCADCSCCCGSDLVQRFTALILLEVDRTVVYVVFEARAIWMEVFCMASVASHLVLLRELLSADRLQFLLQLRNLLSVKLVLLGHLLLDHAITLLLLALVVLKLIFEHFDALLLIRFADQNLAFKLY